MSKPGGVHFLTQYPNATHPCTSHLRYAGPGAGDRVVPRPIWSSKLRSDVSTLPDALTSPVAPRKQEILVRAGRLSSRHLAPETSLSRISWRPLCLELGLQLVGPLPLAVGPLSLPPQRIL